MNFIRVISLVVFFGISLPSISFSQEKVYEWTEFKSEKGVFVYYKYANCDPSIGYDTESILLRIQNSTPKQILIDWNMEIYFNEKCTTCNNGDESNYRFVLNPNQSIEGNCKIGGDGRLKVFTKFTDPQYKLHQNSFSKFLFKDFKVTVIDLLK